MFCTNDHWEGGPTFRASQITAGKIVIAATSQYFTVAKNSSLPSGSGLPENTKPMNILANKAAATTDQNVWGKGRGDCRLMFRRFDHSTTRRSTTIETP